MSQEVFIEKLKYYPEIYLGYKKSLFVNTINLPTILNNIKRALNPGDKFQRIKLCLDKNSETICKEYDIKINMYSNDTIINSWQINQETPKKDDNETIILLDIDIESFDLYGSLMSKDDVYFTIETINFFYTHDGLYLEVSTLNYKDMDYRKTISLENSQNKSEIL